MVPFEAAGAEDDALAGAYSEVLAALLDPYPGDPQRVGGQLDGAGAGECRPLAERAGEIQGTRESQMSAVNRAVCAEALQAMRGELASAERPLPDACDFAPAGGERSAK